METCYVCKEKTDEDDDEYLEILDAAYVEKHNLDINDLPVSSLKSAIGKKIHDDCMDDCMEEPVGEITSSTETVKVCKNFIISNASKVPYKNLEFILSIANKVYYRKTDNWRGYYDVPNTIKTKTTTYKKVIDRNRGTEDTRNLDYLDCKNKGKYNLPKYFVVLLSSINPFIFNTILSVFVEKTDASAFVKKYKQLLDKDGIEPNGMFGEE